MYKLLKTCLEFVSDSNKHSDIACFNPDIYPLRITLFVPTVRVLEDKEIQSRDGARFSLQCVIRYLTSLF